MPPNQSRGQSDCPVLCITKVVLFVVTTLFVLYLPLGDPQVICDARNVPTDQKGLICLCDVYKFLMDTADKTVEVMDRIACSALDMLYEGKLKLYQALFTYDEQDYCSVGCCSDKNDDDNGKDSSCRCKTRFCRRR